MRWQYPRKRGKTPHKKGKVPIVEYPFDITLKAHSDPEWLHLLGFHLWIKYFCLKKKYSYSIGPCAKKKQTLKELHKCKYERTVNAIP